MAINGGTEYRITAIASNTSLTVTPAPGTLSTRQAIFGPGDMLAVIGSNFCTVAGNNLIGSATFGMGLSLGGNSGQCGNNIIRDNVISYSGKNGINISWDSGSGILTGNLIANNRIINAGNGGETAIGVTDRIAIYLASQSTGNLIQTFVNGNFVESATGTDATQYWLGTDSNITAGNVIVGVNQAFSMGASGEYGSASGYTYTYVRATSSTFANLPAGTTAQSSLRFVQGAAPTSPVDGDMWREDNSNTGLKIRINGVTKTITVS